MMQHRHESRSGRPPKAGEMSLNSSVEHFRLGYRHPTRSVASRVSQSRIQIGRLVPAAKQKAIHSNSVHQSESRRQISIQQIRALGCARVRLP